MTDIQKCNGEERERHTSNGGVFALLVNAGDDLARERGLGAMAFEVRQGGAAVLAEDVQEAGLRALRDAGEQALGGGETGQEANGGDGVLHVCGGVVEL